MPSRNVPCALMLSSEHPYLRWERTMSAMLVRYDLDIQGSPERITLVTVAGKRFQKFSNWSSGFDS
jgi:hypothetical protein